MLTISTKHGSFQWAPSEHVKIRRGTVAECRRAVEWTFRGTSPWHSTVCLNFTVGHEVKLPGHGWTPILAASWNEAYYRQWQTEQAVRREQRKAREKARGDGEEAKAFDPEI
jgi:hypothetical protein